MTLSFCKSESPNSDLITCFLLVARVNITANTELELVVGEGGQMDTAGGDTVLRYEDVQYRQSWCLYYRQV